MGVSDLQVYLSSSSLEGGAVLVDLLKIARNVTQRQQPHNTNRKIRPIGNKLKLIVDAENCLDRLYGGYFSDWTCGGQWNRMFQFLSLLTRAILRGNIELAVVFNGTIESCRMSEWVAEQANVRQRVGMVLKHINTKGTPPPKIWWTPPTTLRSALRMALRHLGLTVMCTMDDHHQEVIAYCREYGFHGLLADDAEYAAFDPPRYFSSQQLKLTYKGSLETKEYMLSELTKSLHITQEQVCIMAALLGNFLLPESDLQDFYKKIGMSTTSKDITKSPYETNVKILADYVRNLPPPSNMNALVIKVFGSLNDPRASRFRQSVQYYLNGTASGFLKYCAPPMNSKEKKTNVENNCNASKQDDQDLDVSGFASETTEQEKETLENYKLATANLVMQSEYELDGNGSCSYNTPARSASVLNKEPSVNGVANGTTSSTSSTTIPATSTTTTTSGTKVDLVVSSSSSNTSSVPSSPKQTVNNSNNNKSSINLVTPTVSPDVLRTASLRHQKGLMAPMILHVLSTQEVRLPCLMEDEGNREFPPIHDIYQPLRQHIYAVLFNLHHLRYVYTKKRETGEIPENILQPDIIVKEWIYSRSNPYQNAEEVKAEPLPWAVPTLQRLWFGPTVDDKRRRMRALLSCLNSDTPLILNTDYVPQHMLIMACVLRYVMSQDRAIMRKHELDAFLCQAFNEDLMNPQYLQELTLNVVTSRGVQLAALFMQGVEMSLLANDACGAPLPWLMCCPWLYFDGKLFHDTLNRSAQSKSILEVCENHIERVVKVERMRKAILEGLDIKFAKVPLPPFSSNMIRHFAPPHIGLPTNMQLPNQNRLIPSGLHRQQRPLSSRGGQLQVGGVVVGSWGANYSFQPSVRHQTPQLMGFQGRGRPNMLSNGGGHQQQFGRGRGAQQQQQQHNHHQHQHHQRKSGQPTFNVNKKNNNANKKRNNTNRSNKNQLGRGHTLTVKTENGDVPVSEVIIKRDESKASEGGKSEDCNNKITEHKGQGDAPVLIDSASH